MLEGLGRWSARHHRAVLIAWLVIAVGALVAAATWPGKPIDTFSIPGTNSQQALDVLEADFPSAAAASATVVFYSTSGADLTTGAPAQAIGEVVDALGKLSGVASVSNPLAAPPPGIPAEDIPASVSANKSIAYSTVQFTEPVTAIPPDSFTAITAATAPASAAGIEIAFRGPVVDAEDTTATQGGISEHADLIGLGFAVVILMVALGSVVAMIVPIGSALIGVWVSSSLLTAAMFHFTIGSAVPALGVMIGLGVGIDYSLFIVTRHRQELRASGDVIGSAGRATARAGSAVLFAGISVCLALAGLTLIGIPYVATMGLAAAMFVLVAMLAAITLIPALLGALGTHIESLRLHRRDEADPSDTFSARWAELVCRRPVPFVLAGVALLVLLTIPVARMDLGFPSDADDPPNQTQRIAYDKITEAFGPGSNGPLLVVASLPEPTAANAQGELTALGGLVTALRTTDGVAGAYGPIPNDKGTAALIQVVPTTGSADPATNELVERLRNQVIPDSLRGTSIDASQVAVGGVTAELIDLGDLISKRLPWFIGAVVLAAFLLLMTVFRSILVPLKAAVFNLLSIGAAYGVLVAVFQWGWMRDLVALDQTVPVAPFIPVLMFAVLFGLSMDYEVFLLSRIREEWDKTKDPTRSVVDGVAHTARVITAAALIMISVFLAFVTNPNPVIKMLGFGMAVAVFVDATIVRLMLVPSVMRLFGRRAWWLPHWLDRVLPHLAIDAPPRSESDTDDVPVGAGR